MASKKEKAMKFDPKKYQNKERIYKTLVGYHRISRLYVWDKNKKRYDVPQQGKSYLAKKSERNTEGKRVRVSKYFETLQDALDWQSGKIEQNPDELNLGITFAEVVADWRKKKFPQKAHTTQIAYEKMLNLYFNNLINVPMYRFTAKTIDGWLDELKDPKGKFMQSSRRIAFDHELDLLSGILRFYREYHDETFQHPVMRRHREDVHTGREPARVERDIRYNDFQHFINMLKGQENGLIFGTLAIVQYSQALRISEVSALHWEDVLWNHETPKSSRLLVRRSVIWTRKKDVPSYIRFGFKNSKSNNGIKEHPLLPESYFALKSLYTGQSSGLIF